MANNVPRGLIKNGDIRVRSCRHGMMLYSIKDIYIGRSFDSYGEYGEAQARLLTQLLSPGDRVVEVGGHIGALTLPLAKAVGEDGQVIVFEPQRRIHQMLCANLAMNNLSQVFTQEAAVGASEGLVWMPLVDYSQPQDFAAARPQEEEGAEAVPQTTIDAIGLDACRLIKVTTGGGERDAIMGAAETIRGNRPILFVENQSRDQSSELIQLLNDWNYSLYWHHASLFRPDNFYQIERNLFGPMTRVHLLCLPPELNLSPKQLRPVAGPDDWWES